MGFASVILLGMLLFVYKTVASVICYFVWRNKPHMYGVIEELRSKTVNYINRRRKSVSTIDYVYLVSVNVNEKTHMLDYVETVFGDKPSNVKLASSVLFFVDTYQRIAKNPEDMKRQIKYYSFSALILAAIFIGCGILASVL